METQKTVILYSQEIQKQSMVESFRSVLSKPFWLYTPIIWASHM
jgi:hypothetical protein